MTDVNKQELRRLAEAVERHSDEIGEHEWYDAAEMQSPMMCPRPDAEFIAAVTPATVLALLDEIEAVHAMANSSERRLPQRALIEAAHAVADRLHKQTAAYKAENIQLRILMRHAYRAGWDRSGEGWNAEHPCGVEDGERWTSERDQDLAELLREVRRD